MACDALVTGGAGFIGSHVVDALLARGKRVVCLDNFTPYYDPTLKRARAARHLVHPGYQLVEGDICDRQLVNQLFEVQRPRVVIHLAAYAGVRPSIVDPFAYVDVNVNGTLNLLHAALNARSQVFVNASSSSVYGENPKLPFEESDALSTPASPYGASKLGAEALVRVYASYGVFNAVSLRFFTVYGPRQRPDMAIARFAQQIQQREPVSIYGDGMASRDFTFVSDIVGGILASAEYRASAYEAFNLASGRRVTVLELVETLERTIGARARRVHLDAQQGDVPVTCASVEKARRLLGYVPRVGIEAGLSRYVQWLQNSATTSREPWAPSVTA